MSSAAEINGRQTQPLAKKAEKEPRALMEQSMLGLIKQQRKGSKWGAEPDPTLLLWAQIPNKEHEEEPRPRPKPGAETLDKVFIMVMRA